MRLKLLRIKFLILHKLKFLTKPFSSLEGPKRTVALLLVVAIVPAFVAASLFYGAPSIKNIASSINFVGTTDNTQKAGDRNTNNNFNLELISEELFLEKYRPTPALLPQPLQLSTSLSGFIKSNSTSELLPARNWSVPFIDTSSTAAIATSAPSGRILYGKNVTSVRPIASISKLVTALVAIENMDLSEIVTISQQAVATEGNSGGFVAGEQLTVEQLLYALMLESSNDAAVAIEEHYNKIKPEEGANFVELMNLRVKQMQIGDTNFEEPSGLSPSNVSSAQSVAKILWVAFQNEKLREVMAAPSYTTSPHNKDMVHNWINLNTLLGTYEGILAGKTGFINEAGPSMAVLSATTNPDKFVIVVVLDADDRVERSRELLNWVQKAYIWEE